MVKSKQCQCGSCEQEFLKKELNEGSCPHCGSGNWVYGHIDQEEALCEACGNDWKAKFQIKPLWAVMKSEDYYGDIFDTEQEAQKQSDELGLTIKKGWGVFPCGGQYMVADAKDIHFDYDEAVKEAELFYKGA